MKILELKKTKGNTQLLINFKIPLTKKAFKLVLMIHPHEYVWVGGMPSRCNDHLHVLFFDYDHIKQENVENEIRGLQKYYRLSHAYLFKNDKENSFHAVILDKKPMMEVFNILQNSSVDTAFLNAPKYSFYREWALRITKKGERQPPVFLKIINSPFDEHEISTAHKRFLILYHGIPDLYYQKEDGNQTIEIVQYQTAKENTELKKK